jgi:hypothetical protein
MNLNPKLSTQNLNKIYESIHESTQQLKYSES